MSGDTAFTGSTSSSGNGSTIGYRPSKPTHTSEQTSNNGGSNTSSTNNPPQTSNTQRFACSSGRYTQYEIPWNPQGFKIVTEYGDTVFIENEHGPTNVVNWRFDNNSWIKVSAIGTVRDTMHLSKGSKLVMKLDGATGNFKPDTEFYNYVTVCSAWSVTRITFN